ncbi:MAG: DUF5004 domain-containing protein, partial [Bacteroidales bacterium]|jgi:hypothetical protein|nr:DUF5004 domain-containing protein [Bacteroidales bacterium]
MKKLLLGSIGLILLLSGCRYEEGPFINFTGVEKRIRGSWSMSNVYKNGEETNTESPTVVETKNAEYAFYKNGLLNIKYIENNIVKESSGSWEFGNKKKTIRVVFLNQYYNISREYEIVKFKTNELKLRFTDENGVKWTLVFSLNYSFVPYGM